MTKPKRITLDTKTGNEFAYFDYEDGDIIIKKLNLKETIWYHELHTGKFYLYDDEMDEIVVAVSSGDFPEIKRIHIRL